jgi:predicted DCC family thiol-disulfide oxidoreductase YuxK
MLYDGDCPMCTFQMLMIQSLDWWKKIEIIPIKDTRAQAIAPDITREDLLEAIHCITPEGVTHRGARAFRHLGFKIPLLLPLGLFLWFPGVIQIAEVIYKFIADRRHVISKLFGCKGACEIFPDQKK